MDKAKITVIVSNFNGLSTLKLCLESLRFQTIVPHAVFVADDGSTDGSLQWMDKLPESFFPFTLRYITLFPHAGFRKPKMHNYVQKFVETERMMFTDSDMLLSPRSVEAHSSMGANVVGCGIVISIGMDGVKKISLDMLNDFSKVEAIAKQHHSGRNNEQYTSIPAHRLSCWGGNFSVTKSTLNKAGGWDETYLYGGDETNVIKRMEDSGAVLEWVMNSRGFHLDHPPKGYKAIPQGIEKYYAQNPKDLGAKLLK